MTTKSRPRVRPEIINGMDVTEYHSASGRPYVTSHLLAIYISGGIKAYLHAIEHPSPETEARRFGSAFHSAMEGWQKFNEEFVVGGPVNPTTGRTFGYQSLKFQEWESSHAKRGIRAEDKPRIEAMVTNAKAFQPVQQILKSGNPEVCVRGELLGMPCQMLADWITTSHAITDWKTCEKLARFNDEAIAFGYDLQLGFYQMLYREVARVVSPCFLVACEKSDEAPLKVIRLLRDRLFEAEQKVVRYLSHLKKDLRKAK